MAIQLNQKHFGMLIDFFNSQNDLKQKSVKVLHNLSFVEDPSRIFRAVRFEKRMGFQISPHTRRLIINAVNMKLFGKSEDSRFLSELKIIFSEENPLPAIQRLAEFDLFQFLWPDLRPHYEVDRRFMHTLTQAQLAISWFRLLYLDEPCRNWVVYLLAIMSRSGLDELVAFCKRFGETAKTTEYLLDQKDRADKALNRLSRDNHLKNSDIVSCFEEITLEGVLYIMAIARKNQVKKAISLYVTSLRHVEASLSGNELKNLGYKPGPQFKKILKYLKNLQLDNLDMGPEEASELVKKKFPR
jgi:tRNA nucleotidyltransferase (CCA-adding enzyme)